MQNSRPLIPRRSRLSAVAGVSLVSLSALLLSACAVVQGPPPPPSKPEPPKPDITPHLLVDGSAEENLEYFTEVIRSYSEGDGPIKSHPIVDAIAEAGFNKSDMQVSFDHSKTGYDADSIFVSVKWGSDCLLGQLVFEDRSFAVDLAPAVGPDSNICLLGNTQPITW